MLRVTIRILIVDFNKNEEIVSYMVHNGFDQEKLIDLMVKIGYGEIQSKTFHTGNKNIHGAGCIYVYS